MPIYDNDGTTSKQISALYDNAGASSIQIGYVYDNDGTTDHLIYTSAQYLFNYGSVSGVSWTMGRGAWLGDDFIGVAESSNDFASLAYTAQKIDLTRFSTLKAYVKLRPENWVGGQTGIIVNTEPSTLNVTKDTHIKNTAENANKYFTLAIDISDISGSYYIVPYCANASSGGYFYQIWLE